MNRRTPMLTSIFACCMLFSVTMQSQGLDEGLTHYFDFDSNFTSSGTMTAVTLTGHADGGNAIYSVDGKFGKAINGFFKQGVDDAAIVPLSGDATCSFWFYPNQSAQNTSNGWSIIGRGASTYVNTNTNNNTGWRLIARSSNQVELIWFNGTTRNWSTRQTLAGGKLNIGAWNHIAWKREGTTIKLFVNGVATSTTSNTAGAITAADTWSKEFHTGSAYKADANSWYRGFLGEDAVSAMDEFGWWNRALTDAEITEFAKGDKPISQYFPTKKFKLSVGDGGSVSLMRGTVSEELVKAEETDGFYTIPPGNDALNFTATPSGETKFVYWVDQLAKGNICNIISEGPTYSTYPMSEGHVNTLFTRYKLPTPWTVQFDAATLASYFTSVKVNGTPVYAQTSADEIFSLIKFGSPTVVAGKPGSVVTLSLECTNTTNNLFQTSKGQIYFDANCNGDFVDAGELVVAEPWKAGTSKTTSFDVTFTIPLSATTGNSMIRIVMTNSEGALPLGPTESITRYCYDLPVSIKTPVITLEQPTDGTLVVVDDKGTSIVNGSKVPFGTELIITGNASSEGKHLKYILINGEPIYTNRVTVADDMTISAVFTSDWYVKYNTPANGSISVTKKSDGSTVENDTDLAPNTEINVKLVPETGYEVKTVTINNEDAMTLFTAENDYTATLAMAKNQVINIEFAKKKFAITFNMPDSETGTMTILNQTENVNLTSGALVEYGSEIVITAKESSIATFASLKINGVERKGDLVANKLTISSLTEALDINVEFVAMKYDLSWTIAGGGMVKAFDTNANDEEVMSGSQVVKSHYLYLEITPEEGYKVSSFKMNGEEVDITEANPDLQIEEGRWVYWFEMADDLAFEVTFIDPVGLTNVQGDLMISYDAQSAVLTLSENTEASIIDLSGKVVRNVTEPLTSLNELSNGVYFVKAATMTQQKTIKIVKK